MRIFHFVLFTLTEYIRSGRILVEIIAAAAVFYIFFLRYTVQADYFFSTAGVLVLILTFYTTSVILGLGDRPQGYVLLVRKLGRGGYLLGLYLAAFIVEMGFYGIISLATALLNPAVDLDIRGWVLGTIPLALNVALLGALLMLLTPIVLTASWRLVVLAVVALAFSGNLIGGPILNVLWEPIRVALDVSRTIFSTPLLPAFTGFSLSVTRDYSNFNIAIPFAQLSLTLSLIALSMYAFSKRDIIFSSS
ncbi:MAG: hypothetical protein AAGF95_27610 [Chloroflexota bacterium]